MSLEKMRSFNFIVLLACLSIFLSMCGCIDSIINPSGPPVASGHVYLDGKAIGNATIEAVSANGTDHKYTVTDDNGFYSLNIMPDTWYNVTATYNGLRHTIWPVYLPGEMNSFDINLTATPMSTIEGSGYTTISKSPFEEDKRYDIYYHTRWSGFLIEAKSMKDNTTVSAITDKNGSYVLKIEPDTIYVIAGYVSASKNYPMAIIKYRNDATPSIYSSNSTIGAQTMVGPNETAFVDYVIPMP
jgi:hypothetical protein